MAETYDNLLAAFEGKFKYVYDEDIQSNESHSYSGIRYDQTYEAKESRGGKPGEPVVYPDKDAAFEAWFKYAETLIPSNDDGPTVNTLFWRVKPHVLMHGGGVYAFASLAFGKSRKNGQWNRPVPGDEAQ